MLRVTFTGPTIVRRASCCVFAVALLATSCTLQNDSGEGSDGGGVEEEVEVDRGFVDYSERAAEYLASTSTVEDPNTLDWIAIAEMAIRCLRFMVVAIEVRQRRPRPGASAGRKRKGSHLAAWPS